jgi:hypothetical protein
LVFLEGMKNDLININLNFIPRYGLYPDGYRDANLLGMTKCDWRNKKSGHNIIFPFLWKLQSGRFFYSVRKIMSCRVADPDIYQDLRRIVAYFNFCMNNTELPMNNSLQISNIQFQIPNL